MLPWILLNHRLTCLSFSCFVSSWRFRLLKEWPSCSKSCSQNGTLCVQRTVLGWQKVGSYMQMYILEVPKLAQTVLKVYFFFQIQMWPWQCYFQNESCFQNLQFEDPKPLACKSVPGLWICMKPCPTPAEVPSQPCYALCWGAGQGHLIGVTLRRVGLLGTLGAFCCFLVSAVWFKTTFPNIFLYWRSDSLSTFMILIIEWSCTAKASNVFCGALDKPWGVTCELLAWMTVFKFFSLLSVMLELHVKLLQNHGCDVVWRSCILVLRSRY